MRTVRMPRRIGSIKALKNMVPLFRRDADACIAYRQTQMAVDAGDIEINGPGRPVVLDRIVQQVVQDFAKLVGVRLHWQCFGSVQPEGQPLRLGKRANQIGAIAPRPGRRYLFPSDAPPPHPGAQRQEAFHEVRHLRAAGTNVFQHLAVFRRRAQFRTRQLERGHHGGERRAQLV